MLSSVGGVAVLAVGVIAVVRGGWGVASAGVTLMGVALVAVALFDYPVATTFDADGVTRRMVLRRHHLAWSSIDQLSRTRPGLMRNLRKLAHGGLVAVRGRRRYLLVDQCESLDEFGAVVRHAVYDGVDLAAGVPVPPDATLPTWLHRRSKWAPDRGTDR